MRGLVSFTLAACSSRSTHNLPLLAMHRPVLIACGYRWGYGGKQVDEVPMVKYNFIGVPSAQTTLTCLRAAQNGLRA